MHLALRVLAAAQALEKASVEQFRAFGLSPAQFGVLNLLSDRSEGTRASDLARALGVDPSNVTGLLKRMKRDGLLDRAESGGDRREHVVRLSAKGFALWKEAHGAYNEGLERLEAILGPEEKEATAGLLLRLVGAIPVPVRSRPRAERATSPAPVSANLSGGDLPLHLI